MRNKCDAGNYRGKWKPCLIDAINNGVRRPSELLQRNPGAGKRVLHLQLKELEEHGVIRKVIYPVLPLKVEYYLTALGESLIPLIRAMEDWGADYMPEFTTAQKVKAASAATTAG